MGTRRVVVLHGREAVKEALIDQGDEFSARGVLPLFEKIFKGSGLLLVASAHTDDISGMRKQNGK